MRKTIITLSFAVCLLLVSPVPSFAANTVQVTLPSFSVTLNGQTTGNDYSKFPLIVYKDITYFPMTYYDCRLLGLKTDWTANTGLVISKNEDYFYEYLREVNNSKNTKKQTAKLADGKITVNGKVIDNRKEKYPLLVFRDITYFPLTWRFAVNEFGWDYCFNQKDGLIIDNDHAKLENPEKWKFFIFKGASMLGRGSALRIQSSFLLNHLDFSDNKSTTLPIKYFQQAKKLLQQYNEGNLLSLEEIDAYIDNAPENEWQSLAQLKSVELFTITLIDMLETRCNFVDARIAYQVYKQIGSKEELVYQYTLPPLNGDIGYTNWAEYTFATNFWLNITPGTYKFHFALPEYFSCYKGASTDLMHWNTNDIYFIDTIHDFSYKIIEK